MDDPNSKSLDNLDSLARLKTRLTQVDALIAEGVLSGDAAKAARADLEAQVLALVLANPNADPASATTAAVEAGSGFRAPRRLVYGLVAFVAVFAAAGYAWLGKPEALGVGPGNPAALAQAGPDEARFLAMVEGLAERLKTKPDDAEGWSMLGRSYGALGRDAEAAAAYKKAYELKPQDAQAMADYADGLALANNRSLDGEPEQLIMAAVKLDPANVKALALAGTVSFNRADYPAAVDYWERAINLSDSSGEFAKQVQGALNEARQRSGMPTAGTGQAGAGPAAAASQPITPGREAITGRLTLNAGLQGKVGPDDTVFIFARAPSGSRMPLAILRKKVSDLPLDFKLDDSLAMSPAARLSSASQVVIGARISKTGNAMPSPGDWQVLSDPVALGVQGLKLEISEAVR